MAAAASNSVPLPPISPDDSEPTRWLSQAHPTPKFGNDGYCTIASAVRIAAPPATCLRVVLNAPGYASPGWNKWVRGIEIVSKPNAESALPAEVQGPDFLAEGARFNMSIHMDQSDQSAPRVQKMDVTACEPISPAVDGRSGFRISWTYCMAFGLCCERVQEFVDDGSGGTIYTTWETFGGILARAVWMTSRDGILAGVAEWGRGLKQRAEEIARGSDTC